MPFSIKTQKEIKADLMKYYTKTGKNNNTKASKRSNPSARQLTQEEWEETKAFVLGHKERLQQGEAQTQMEQRLQREAQALKQREREDQFKLEQEYNNLYPELKKKNYHENLRIILANIEVGNLVFLVGPAGSGKTTIAMSVAEILEKDFYFTGAVHQKHELLGFTDAKGDTIRTPFREAFEHGGIFLFDEYDASSPHAITAFNAALSNGHCAFPDGIIEAHENFIAIAAGNTYGTGATRQYVGRFQQDAASLDRFVFIEIDYDIELETNIALDAYKKLGGKNHSILFKYLKQMRKIRSVVRQIGLQHIVSPRAAIQGAKLLAKGVKQDVIENIVIYKGMSPDQRKQIESVLNRIKQTTEQRHNKRNPYRDNEEAERALKEEIVQVLRGN